jgi:CDP-diacylglycerol--glycerol-3-phosphate 3-phosphatidyltransferase
MKLNLPNKLTVFRMILVPIFVFVYLVPFIPFPAKNWVALVIFCVASLTDFVDGRIARSRHMITDFGKFMDPLADKLLVDSALICFVGKGLVPAWVVVIIIGREFVISGFRLVAADKGVVIAAGPWGKVKTAVQMFAVIALLIPITASGWYVFAMVLVYISTALSIISVVDYIARNANVLKEE